jgi:GTP cyclohydrolase II
MTDLVTIKTSVPFSGERGGVMFTAEFVTFSGFSPEIMENPPNALIFGSLEKGGAPLVRLHSGCRTGDVFGSRACDCGAQLTDATRIMHTLANEGQCGVVIYIPHHEGRGMGINAKIQAYDLMRNGLKNTYEANTTLGYPADSRDYTCAAQIIHALGLTQIRLLTGSPAKISGVERLSERYGFKILECVPTSRHETPQNAAYLREKEKIGGHVFTPV